MRYMLILALCLMCTACTYSITIVHSSGSTDTLDEALTNTPDISPTLTIPLTSGV